MRALVKERPGPGMELREVPDPVPGPGEVLIRVETSSVCGSDIARYKWSRNYEAGASKAMTDDLPRIMGHESAGVVVEGGPGVTGLTAGDRVAVFNVLGCGRCSECDRGLPNLCRDRRTIGVHRDGGYAELMTAPERNCYRIPDTMSFHLAAGVTPFAVSSYAVEHAHLEPGERIAIWGSGPIGLAVMLAARLRGVEDALVIDLQAERLKVAAELGAQTLDVSGGDAAALLLERAGARSLDAVFEAAGAPETVAASLPVLRKRRTMVLIGNMRSASEIDLMPLIMDQQRLVGSRSASLAAWSRALRTAERSGFERTLDEEVGLDQALDRFALAAEGRGGPFTIQPNA